MTELVNRSQFTILDVLLQLIENLYLPFFFAVRWSECDHIKYIRRSS